MSREGAALTGGGTLCVGAGSTKQNLCSPKLTGPTTK